MDEQKRWNVNELGMYDIALAEWEARYARRPVMLKKPFVLWGRLIFDIGSDKQARVVPTVSEVPVTLLSCGESKVEARFKRGWRILKYWVPRKSELAEINTDDVQHGWRFQYATDPKGFEDIAKRLEYYKSLGEGRQSADTAIVENATLRGKLAKLEAQLNGSDKKVGKAN
jgi:hypothetical protein